MPHHGGGHHGGGFHSGGGHHGGGFHHGGGGHHTVIHHGGGYHYYGGGGGGDCCWCLCNGIRAIVSCVIFMVFLAVALAIALPVALLSDHSCNHVDELIPGEQAVCQPSSSYGVAVTTLSSTAASVYRFSGQPAKETTSTHIQKTASTYVSSNSDEYFAFALTYGSTVYYNITSDDSVRFMILTPSNYRRMHNDESYDYEREQYGYSFKSSWSPSEDEMYYFVVYNTWSFSSASVKWSFDVSLKRYDVTRYVDKCSGQYTCEFYLSDGDFLIADMPTTASGTVDVSMKVRYGNGVRTGVIVAIITVPLVIIVLSVLIAVRRSRRLRDAAAAPLIAGQGPTTTVVVQPTPAGYPTAPPPAAYGGGYPSAPMPPPAYPGAGYAQAGIGPDGMPPPPPAAVAPPPPGYLYPGGVAPLPQQKRERGTAGKQRGRKEKKKKETKKV